MEGLARLVSESMARHGVECSLDYRRLHWSPWLCCRTTFDLSLVPALPGIFAIAEELVAPHPASGSAQRMLAVLEVRASDDLAIAMARLFAPGGPLKDRISAGRIFTRFTLIEDGVQRRAAHAAFERWLTTSDEAAVAVNAEAPYTILKDWGNVTRFPSPENQAELAGVQPTASPAPRASIPR
ncbi:MAG: hypothetical protein JO266_00135 [Acidobacteria bacterium]|nr:hypothetical protein [Acidobacteriota bacterium]MBV8890389.1 hypothetical protein [Acidobacteriota bacterium]MBV9479749.1 hypothetical protein [Acidobacteriota bacterium]